MTPRPGWEYNPTAIDAALYQAFGQSQVSTIYKQLNQYHVVMEVDPRYQQTPERVAKRLRAIEEIGSAGAASKYSATTAFPTPLWR